ncbi:ABC transporter permease [Clostridium saccharobutylicum]|uniref:ABC superfamily ATP binding cassette transporter permease subunit n=1 Tax=Clostridium saccharobutylicum DSM 13864 TaxID=1345695 RepID=U5MPM3_CLOSA|nr:ABC transporter permease [Clostridium saccharobutylicum]AGX41641.1 ABC superfamily ATP binding cassette transporter permease subunit [Clostridium saccharobutylicum DSM 13864]AQR88924.1 ABC-2 family transporter protein [Clostridium saccharobutylicum]AQR98825.1 ABC-2 family transporter protein [Clostridium saccharobutylicum]AQS12813.1 ABC-2 family transporter protein [Clostridium saccharobutylicum]MBA2904075.1 ABC-type transport system involved in multi-copper enzyme maturation permease subun
MINIIVTEFQKLKRYSILWIGIVAVLFSVLLAAFQQNSSNEIIQYESYTNSVIWNNFSMIFPFMIVLIGGYIINREYVDHTLKNMLTVPIPFRKLLMGKLITVGLVTTLYGFFSFICTFLLGIVFYNRNMSSALVVKSLFQLVGLSLCCYLAVLPIIIFFSRKQNGFLAGVGLAFVYGFCGIFIAGRALTDYYPITAGLGIIKFTGDDTLNFNLSVEIGALSIMIILSMIMLFCMKGFEDRNTLSKNTAKKHKG